MEAGAVPRAAPPGVSVFLSPGLLRLASDSNLVALIRQGRPAAFEAAYDRHQRAILSFCRHMLGDPEEAQDALQHTFLAAYNDLIGSQKPIHLRAWLFTIARNRCYSVLRSRREHPTYELSEAITEGLATQVQRRQDLRDLVIDMRRLPEDQRAALVLAELDALSHQEIGEVLGVPKDKVKALVFQARESLIASRAARETDCLEIRQQLATQHGGGLRRANLRRHLRECAGCRDYRKQVERQRRQLAVAIPVIGTVALKDAVLGAVGGGAGAGAVGGGLLASSAFKAGIGKALVGAVLATVGAAGTIVATSHLNLLGSAPPRALVNEQHVVAPGVPAASHITLENSSPRWARRRSLASADGHSLDRGRHRLHIAPDLRGAAVHRAFASRSVHRGADHSSSLVWPLYQRGNGHHHPLGRERGGGHGRGHRHGARARGGHAARRRDRRAVMAGVDLPTPGPARRHRH